MARRENRPYYPSVSDITPRLFAPLWHVPRTPAFVRHIELLYRTHVARLPVLKGVVLVEVDAGDVQHGWVQSNPVRWWVADDGGFRSVAPADQPPAARDLNAAADAGLMYHGWLGLAFFVDGDRVAVRARLGPDLFGRTVGRVVVVGGVAVFTDVRVARNWAETVRPDSPVVPELELRMTT